jgi:bromodomain-containing factor 1
MREKDIELGAFFSEPVDPVALGIPTYYQIIKEPMDLRTIQRKMEAGEVSNPEEFARLVRLVFENAMTFNIDPAHSVHQAARNLLVMFNQKYRDVDRMVQSIRRTHGVDADFDLSKGKGGKKRKRQEEVKSLKRIRLEEAQAMTSANASAIAAIVAAAPANTTTVSRSEFNMMLHMIQQLQAQIVQTHKAVADLSPGEPSDAKVPATTATGSSKATYSAPRSTAPAPAPEKKKPTQRKSETKAHEEMVAIDDSAPLSLEEQELLTETINELPQEHLGGVIQIIREAAPVGADEDEIDLEIDQLEVKTQRKLLRHIMKVRLSVSRGALFTIYLIHTNALLSAHGHSS